MSYLSLHLFVATAVIIVNAVNVMAQAPARAKRWTAPRTPDGQPDLQGVRTNSTLTPFESPAEFASIEFFTKEEAAAFAKNLVEQSNLDKPGAIPEPDVSGAYNETFFESATAVASSLRTSVGVDPPDGKMPALMLAARDAVTKRLAIQGLPPEKAEGFALPVRSLVWGTSGPPMVQGPYNKNYQIVQARNCVAMDVEMTCHEANYSLTSMLAGARAEEASGAKSR